MALEIHPPANRVTLRRLFQAAAAGCLARPAMPGQPSGASASWSDRSGWQDGSRPRSCSVRRSWSSLPWLRRRRDDTCLAGWPHDRAGSYFRESASPPVAMRSTPTGGAGGSTTSNRPAGSCDRPTPSTIRAMRRLLDYAGLDPDHALLRWGNFDRTLYLPSTVFVADDTGRSYRFRPGMRSIWVRNLKLKGGILAYFPVPLGPRA